MRSAESRHRAQDSRSTKDSVRPLHPYPQMQTILLLLDLCEGDVQVSVRAKVCGFQSEITCVTGDFDPGLDIWTWFVKLPLGSSKRHAKLFIQNKPEAESLPCLPVSSQMSTAPTHRRPGELQQSLLVRVFERRRPRRRWLDRDLLRLLSSETSCDYSSEK